MSEPSSQVHQPECYSSVEPLVPIGLDIAGFNKDLTDIDKAISSELVAISTGDEFKAATMLRWKARKQNPPGSLPNDERKLAAFSGNPQSWSSIREVAMMEFVLCSDNRWYHPEVARDVLHVAQRKIENQNRTAAATEARRQRYEQRDVARVANVTSTSLGKVRVGKERARRGFGKARKQPSLQEDTGVAHVNGAHADDQSDEIAFD